MTKTLHVHFAFPISVDDLGLPAVPMEVRNWISEQKDDPTVSAYMIVEPIGGAEVAPAPPKPSRAARSDRGRTRVPRQAIPQEAAE